MKAFLLAAGVGSRLRPITDTVPKCLVPVAGKPLMSWWMELFRVHGVTDVLINTHYLPEQVRRFIGDHNSLGNCPQVYEIYEDILQGSAGTVLRNRGFVADEDAFLICYADNITRINLTELMAFHRSHDGILTMALSPSMNPKQAGIVTLDKYSRIVEFEEKPENPKGVLANAGVYVTDNRIFDCFPKQDVIDFGNDIFPRLIGKMYGFHVLDYHLDIGTLESLERARKEWPEGITIVD